MDSIRRIDPNRFKNLLSYNYSKITANFLAPFVGNYRTFLAGASEELKTLSEFVELCA
jgi:hypothetical protein